MSPPAPYPEPDDIVIRATEPGDAHGISQLIDQPEVARQLLQVTDTSHAMRHEWLTKSQPGECRLVAVARDRIVASAGLHLDGGGLRRRHVRSLGISIAPDFQGHGLGQRLMERLLHWADQWAGVLRIELHVHADNARAIRLYEKMGFVQEGRHEAFALRDGSYIASLSMARLHPSPPRW